MALHPNTIAAMRRRISKTKEITETIHSDYVEHDELELKFREFAQKNNVSISDCVLRLQHYHDNDDYCEHWIEFLVLVPKTEQEIVTELDNKVKCEEKRISDEIKYQLRLEENKKKA